MKSVIPSEVEESHSTHIKNKNIYLKDDVLVAAAKIISKINKKQFRHIIINVGTVQGGETPNSIAGYVVLRGDIRTDSNSLRSYAHEWLKKQLGLIEKEFPTIKNKLHYSQGYPILKNDQRILKKVEKIMPILHFYLWERGQRQAFINWLKLGSQLNLHP